MKALQLLTGTAALSKLKEYAPIVVEGGTGRRDQRDPAEVARRVAAALRPRITERQTILVTQGDPLEETGISAITRYVADELAIPRALVTLPVAIDPEHAPNAPREGVILEVGYDALAASLENLVALETAVDAALAAKNRARERPLAPYYRDYALLQEVTKGALRAICGSLTLAHTDSEIPGDSVTSFYEVGLELGLYSREDVVPYV
jgi:hypothetical protein